MTKADVATIQQSEETTTTLPLSASFNLNNSNSQHRTKVSPVMLTSAEGVPAVPSSQLANYYPADVNPDCTNMQTLLCDREQSTMPGADSTLCQTQSSPPVRDMLLPGRKFIEVANTLLVPGVHCTRTNTSIQLPVSNTSDRLVLVYCYVRVCNIVGLYRTIFGHHLFYTVVKVCHVLSSFAGGCRSLQK